MMTQLPFRASGKVLVVGKSALANREIMEELFKVDPDGEVRFFATIDAAVGECDADRHDVIYVMPGHTETLTGASAIDFDITDVTVIGLGNGKNRPQLLLDASANVDIEVAADDVTIENIIFLAGHADITTCFEIGAAKQFTVRNCEFLDNTAGENFKIVFRTNSTDNAADGLTVENCVFITPDTASEYFMHLQGDVDRLVIKDNYINMGVNTSDLAVIMFATGKDGTNVWIEGNRVNRLNDANDLFINNDTTANSGVVCNNHMLHADTGSEVLIDMDGVGCFENYATAVVTASGYLLPAKDS